MRYLIPALALAGALWLVDFYVLRNWRRFARYRGKASRLFLRLYGVLLYIMPLTLPAYLLLFRWWEVEPKLVRAAFVGFWALYYLPKIPIALVLLLKDATRLISWQFQWLRRKRDESTGAGDVPARRPPDLTELRTMSRSEFLRTMGWTAASIPFVVVGYGVFRSLYNFEVQNTVLSLPGLPKALDGIQIAQISDLHAGSFFSLEPVRETVALLNELRPNLIVFTGDFVNNDEAEMKNVVPQLQALNVDIGAFACLGNHDHYARVEQVAMAVGQTPFRLLVNQHAPLVINGAPIYMIGTDNTGFNQHYADLSRATDGIPAREADDLRILLAHDPSYWEQARHARPDIDLTLSGHTHGGQVGFEIGPLRWSLARLVYPRWAGLYSEHSASSRHPQYLYVNRGLGTVGPPVRIGIRPEITMLTLVSAPVQT